MTVRRRACHEFGAENAGATGTVFDQERTAGLFGQLLRELPRYGVDAAAGGVGDDDPHRTRGPALRQGGRCEREGAGYGDCMLDCGSETHDLSHAGC